MTIPFLEANPVIVSESRGMDHSTKEYKKLMQKVLADIGGFGYLLKYLKETEAGKRLRKQYFRYLIAVCACSLSMFAWILIAVALTQGGEVDKVTIFDITVFIWFILAEIASFFLMFFFALRGKRVLLLGVSFLVDIYGYENNPDSFTTLSDYKLQKAKSSKVAIIVGILTFIVVSVAIALSNGTLNSLFAEKSKEFSKSGMTITLAGDFVEQDIVTQTAAYTSAKHMVMSLREDFDTLEPAGLDADSSLMDYADVIIANNALDIPVEGDETRPYFIYSKEISGKNYTYLGMLFKGSNAFWMVTFASESDDYAASEAQFFKWADTIRVE